MFEVVRKLFIDKTNMERQMFQAFQNTSWRLGKSTEIKLLKTYSFNGRLKKPEFKEGMNYDQEL